jgi:integrase
MMSQMKKHVTPIPPNVKHPGFKIRCTHCDTYVTKKCLENQRDLSACCHPEKLEYRSVIHLSNSKHGRKVKIHKTINLNEAIIEHLKFRAAVKSDAEINPVKVVQPLSEEKKTPHVEIKSEEPRLLTEWAAKFIAHMNDIDTPNHLKQNLSKDYLEEIDREMKRMCVSLSKHIDIKAFEMQNLDDTAVGHVCDYLLNVKQYAPRTFNKHMTTYTMFYKWWQKKIRQNGENFFEKVQHKKAKTNPQTIESEKEFEALIAILKPENGFVIQGKRKQKRLLYRPYLEKAFRIGLESGVRRENLVYLKASDIIENDSDPVVLRIENIKVNNILHISDATDKKLIYVPLTANLKNLILDDYNEYKQTGIDKYLIAPETENRGQMADDISRAFSHYYRQLNTGKELKFGALRKAYITQMEIFTGGKAEEVTGHSNDRVLRHYRVPHLIAKAAREFVVYPKENNRQKELVAIRESKTHPTIER